MKEDNMNVPVLSNASLPSADGNLTEMSTEPRSVDGRFKAGNTYSRGRAAGSRNRTTVMLDSLAQEAAEAVLLATVRAAISGDTAAMKLVLDRVYPVRRGRPTPLKLDGVTGKPLSQITAALIEAVANGEQSAVEASEFANVINQHRKAVEFDDIENRLRQLEERNAIGH